MKYYSKLPMIILVISIIAASSIAGGTAYAKKASSDGPIVQNVQQTPDNSQGIPKKLAELQSQIDELRQQVQNIPSSVLKVRVDSKVYHQGGNGQPPFPLRTATASCTSSETLLGGGYKFLPVTDLNVWINGPNGKNWVVQYVSPFAGEETIYAFCAQLSP